MAFERGETDVARSDMRDRGLYMPLWLRVVMRDRSGTRGLRAGREVVGRSGGGDELFSGLGGGCGNGVWRICWSRGDTSLG